MSHQIWCLIWPNMSPRSSLAIIFRSDHTSHDGHQHIHVPTHDYHVLMGRTAPILKLKLHFDLNYTPVKFHDCILQGCEVISRLSTDKHLAQNCCLWQVVLQGGVHRITVCHDDTQTDSKTEHITIRHCSGWKITRFWTNKTRPKDETDE